MIICVMVVMVVPHFKNTSMYTFPQVPIVIPVVFMLWCLFLVIAPIVQNPRIQLLYASCFILAGGLLYFPLIYFNFKPRILGGYFNLFHIVLISLESVN